MRECVCTHLTNITYVQREREKERKRPEERGTERERESKTKMAFPKPYVCPSSALPPLCKLSYVEQFGNTGAFACPCQKAEAKAGNASETHSTSNPLLPH